MRKKRVAIHSNSHFAFTGFGKNCKNILKYLYKTGKYELFEFANGSIFSDSEEKYPWNFYGTLPSSDYQIKKINNDPNLARSASYGLLKLDDLIVKTKPDVYIGI